jgi:chloride channel protein, CIC family
MKPLNWREHVLPVDRAQRVTRLFILCAIVGVVAGLGGILFELATESLKSVLLDAFAGYRPPTPAGDSGHFGPSATPFSPWRLAVLPVVGGLLVGMLVYWLAPDAEGHGTDAAIDAYHNRRGVIRGRVPVIHTIASAITLGTGGSAGPEGPVAQLGAGFGSVMSVFLRLGVQERRVLMVAGMGAGIGALFRAPLAGALFAAEVLYREMDMEFEVIVPAVISSIVAYSVFTGEFGGAALFATPAYRFGGFQELIAYTVLALSLAAGAKTYVRMFFGVRAFFKGLKVPPFVKPALGGVVVGAFALFLPEALASGYGIVQEAIDGKVPMKLLVAMAAGKIVTTAFTVGAGQSGGVLGPAVVIGGALGGVVGMLCQRFMPGLSPPVGAFVVVGMAGFFSGAANTPISTIIMVSEMTGNYNLLVPTMWVCVMTFLLVRRSALFEHQLGSRADSPVHLGEMMGGVLQSLTVQDALEDDEHEPTVPLQANAPMSELVERFSHTRHACYPVVDASGGFVGVVDDRVLRQYLANEGIQEFLVAQDFIERAPLLSPAESLHSAMHKMVTSHHDELVVVEDGNSRQVIGTLSRRDLIAAYDHQIHRDIHDHDLGRALPLWKKIPILGRHLPKKI